MKTPFALFLGLLITLPAWAERADKDKPMLLEAQRVSIDDARKIQILEGDVVITKGTMILRAERVVVTEDEYGFQRSTAFAGKSGLAHFKQKREGREDYVEGEAERIEYNTRNEVAEFFHKAWVKSGEDQIKGNYIWYDAVSEKYLVTAGEASNPKTGPARVRAILQPKNKGPAPEEPGKSPRSGLDLKPASTLSIPGDR